jgi:hypothetical protein
MCLTWKKLCPLVPRVHKCPTSPYLEVGKIIEKVLCAAILWKVLIQIYLLSTVGIDFSKKKKLIGTCLRVALLLSFFNLFFFSIFAGIKWARLWHSCFIVWTGQATKTTFVGLLRLQCSHFGSLKKAVWDWKNISNIGWFKGR